MPAPVLNTLDKPGVDLWVTPAPIPDWYLPHFPGTTWVAAGPSKKGSDWLLDDEIDKASRFGALSVQWYSYPAWLEFESYPVGLIAEANAAGLVIEIETKC